MAAPFYRNFECLDGKFVAVGTFEPKFYGFLCNSMERSQGELPDRHDPGNWDRLHGIQERRFKEKTRDEWCDLLGRKATCVTPVLCLEARIHPHLAVPDPYRNRRPRSASARSALLPKAVVHSKMRSNRTDVRGGPVQVALSGEGSRVPPTDRGASLDWSF
jgi:crotonobetainyl-CoA:carnitine CoA-transferase CaiB-like acyl-CoA transferase